jgi:pyruvate-ferredoxin/flavodoxin oxidoreductase
MNYKAIDAGVEAIVAVDVPAAWKNATDNGADAYVEINVPEAWKNCTPDAPAAAFASGRADLDAFVNNIVTPVNAMAGDKLPVSAFKDCADGTFPQGSTVSEKRGVAVYGPKWNPEHCIQCNN